MVILSVALVNWEASGSAGPALRGFSERIHVSRRLHFAAECLYLVRHSRWLLLHGRPGDAERFMEQQNARLNEMAFLKRSKRARCGFAWVRRGSQVELKILAAQHLQAVPPSKGQPMPGSSSTDASERKGGPKLVLLSSSSPPLA